MRARKKRRSILRVVIDESVSATQWARFQVFAAGKGISTTNPLHVAEHHPGMPDGQILHLLLDKTTVLLTNDRPFHNAALSKGRGSFYISKDRITCEKLPGIRPRPGVSVSRQNDKLQKSYLPPPSEIRPLLMPSSPRKLKKLSTKRRRIRNHFGGLLNLDQIAVTLSCLPLGPKVLIGAKVRVSSTSGQKALDASENYTLAPIADKDRDLAVICHALVLLHQLMLESVKTVIFWDALRIHEPPPATPVLSGSYAHLYTALVTSFSSLEFVATPKGPFVDRLRYKLADLANDPSTNEIVAGDFEQLAQRFKAQTS